MTPEFWENLPVVVAEAVVAREELKEAEPLLLEVQKFSEADRYSTLLGKMEDVNELLRLYELWKKPTEVAKWKKKLAALEKEAKAQQAKDAKPAKSEQAKVPASR